MAGKTENSGMPSLAFIALGAIVVLGLVWFYGTRNPGQLGEPQIQPLPTAAVIAIPSQPALDTPPLPPDMPEVASTASASEFAPPRCGDYSCDANERCDTCSKDCGCAGGEYCNRVNGICYELSG